MIGALNVGRYELRGNRRRKDRDAAASAIRDLADSLEQVLVFRDPFFGLRPLNGRCSAQPMAEMRVEELVARGLAGLRTGCYYGTIAYLEEAAQRDTMLEHLLHFRALAWHKTQRPEEAAADLQRAIIGVRRLQSQSIEDSWYTTAILEYVLGMMYARFNDRVSARRAFERAIGEDLAFYMAHVRLAELAMGRRDLNDAVESLSLATEMRPDDALALASYAQALVAVGRLEDAHAAYAKAITHAPHYADLRFTQAELFDRTGDAKSALDSYRAYVARASRQDSAQIDFANDRIASLTLTPDP
jgi:tetratricopeptide (TPR) repeat protein